MCSDYFEDISWEFISRELLEYVEDGFMNFDLEHLLE